MSKVKSESMLAGLRALETFSLNQNQTLISRGIEKEGLRVDPDLNITQSDHPPALGHPLTHGRITTDYSEALLELITPVYSDLNDLFSDLKETHHYVLNNLGNGVLWAGSMPSRLDGNNSVRIAEYGESNVGQLKHVYRKGLDVRYGRIMQSIAGLHFNFSLNDKFWEALQKEELDSTKKSLSLQNYKSAKYFGLTRNFRRYSWLLMYLFGASPALDKSFIQNEQQAKENELETFDAKGTYFRPYATSLRMSDLGYNNNAQSSLNICFNTLDNFTATLGNAVQESYTPYEKIGIYKDGEYLQLNTNILQIENEYYSAIRPKRSAKSGEKPTQALRERGVEYVEVRCLDLNPYEPLGISLQQAEFMDVFLLLCLLEEAPFFDDEHCAESESNFALTCTLGRKSDLMLKHDGKEISLKDWAENLFEQLEQLAVTLDSKNIGNAYSRAIETQLAKVRNSELCPSSLILKDMANKDLSWLELCGKLSQDHKRNLGGDIPSDLRERYASMAKTSLRDEESIRKEDQDKGISFDAYLENYLKS